MLCNDFTGFDSTQGQIHHELEKYVYEDYLKNIPDKYRKCYNLYMKSLEDTKGTLFSRADK